MHQPINSKENQENIERLRAVCFLLKLRHWKCSCAILQRLRCLWQDLTQPQLPTGVEHDLYSADDTAHMPARLDQDTGSAVQCRSVAGGSLTLLLGASQGPGSASRAHDLFQQKPDHVVGCLGAVGLGEISDVDGWSR